MLTYLVISKHTNKVACKMRATRISFSRDYITLFNGDEKICAFSCHDFYVTEAYR